MKSIKNTSENLISLRLLFPLLLGVFIFILIFIFGYSSYQVSRKALTASVLDSFSRDAHLARTQILDFLHFQFQALRAIEETPPIPAIFRAIDNDGVDPQSGDDLDTWRQRIEQIMISSIRSEHPLNRLKLRLLDSNGKEIVRVDRTNEKIIRVPKVELQNKFHRLYFKETIRLEKGEYSVSPIDLNREHGQIIVPFEPTLRIAIPVFDDNNSKRGILVANLDPQSLFDLLAQRPTFENIYLINQEGDFLIHPNRSKTFGFELGFNYKLSAEHPDLAVLLQTHDEYISSSPSLEVKHHEHFDGFTKIYYNPAQPSQFWTFAFDISSENVLAPIIRLRNNLILLAVVVTSIFIILGYIINSRYLVKPIITLSSATRKVAEGDYTLEMPESKRRDEIGILTRSFNQMTSGLRKSYTELKQKVVEAKQTAEALRQSEENYRSLVETAADPVIVIDESARVCLWNKAASDTFGFSSEEMNGKSLKRIYPVSESFDEYKNDIAQFIEKGESTFIGISREVQTKHKDNHLIDLLLSTSARKTDKGWLFTAFCKDITTEKHARREIERLAGFPRENPLPVVEINSEGNVTYINPAGLMSLKRMNLEKEEIHRILPSDYKKLVRECLNEGVKMRPQEVALNNLVLLWSGHPLEKLNVVHFYATDITELKRAEQELITAKERAEVSDRLKSNFLSTMSHEVRTPLTTMLGYTDLLASQLEGKLTELERGFLDTIEDSGNRLKHLMDDILDISLIEADQTALHLEISDGDNLVKGAIREISLAAQKKNLDVVEKLHAPKARIMVDKLRLRQALGNILQNAVKFTSEGSITVSTNVTEDEYQVAVSDTGVGISEEFKPYLFSLFRQEEEGYDRSYEGAGLGLAISQRFVSAMGGRIEVESQEREGSTFRVYFPVRNEEEFGIQGEDMVSSHSETSSGPADRKKELKVSRVPFPDRGKNGKEKDIKKKKVLILEDNPANRRYIEFLLKKLQVGFISAESGEKAMKLLEIESVDGMLIDISLAEGMSGVEFMKRVKRMKKFEIVPVIAVTAHAMEGQKEEYLAVGFDDYLAKPFMLKDLEKILNRNLLKKSLST